jgi:hypothetical protein
MSLTRKWLVNGPLVVALLGALPTAFLGCGAEGTVEVKDAEATRKKMEGDSTVSKKISADTQAKNQALEDEAGKKHPKLR